jgi:hypothetical protein
VPAFVRAESIGEFVSDITLAPDSSLTVTENIVYEFGDQQHHGIYRTIPLTHPDPSERRFYDRYTEVSVETILMDNAPVPYTTEVSGDTLTITIGDPDHTITGDHRYTLMYTVRGALSYARDHTDLYWNVTGTGWDVPIGHVLARVSDGEDLYVNDGACYRGAEAATTSCDQTVLSTSVEYVADDLAPGEGLTIARGVNQEKVAHVVLERLTLVPFWLIGAAVWLVGLGIYVFRTRRFYRTGDAIIAQYEPLPGVKPLYAGLLMDGRVDARDVTAGIVSLAEQDFLKITRTEHTKLLFFKDEDYEITLTRPYAEIAGAYERTLFTLLFDADASVGNTVSLDALAADTSQLRANYKLLQTMKRTAAKDLITQGYFEHGVGRALTIIGVLAVAIPVLLTVTALLGADIAIPIGISVVTFALSFGLVLLLYRRRTKKGYEAKDYLKGFKRFLSVTDAERFAFHNAPQKSPEQFMAYLPYAIAFGVEKEWAAVFKDIAVPEPDWYDGHGAAFNAAILSNNLSSFHSAFSHAAGTSPASTGGGSVGGGAGGGGGSW